jgi:hypothetical protein
VQVFPARESDLPTPEIVVQSNTFAKARLKK